MIVLGLHGGITQFHHEPAAALIVNGRLVAAAEEERFVRQKTALGHIPINATAACLKEAGLTTRDVDLVVHSGETNKDLQARIRLYLEHYFGYSPRIELINHQLAHLASAFYCSKFERAMCISYDGYGDDLSAALAVGSPDGIEILETRGIPESLGRFYSVMTSFLGFGVAEAEYKVMGLASYGKPGIDLSAIVQPGNADYTIDDRFFRGGRRVYTTLGRTEEIENPSLGSRYEPWYNRQLVELLGDPRRRGDAVSNRHRDIAYATQKAFEGCAIAMARRLHERTGLRRLALAGGCALNCTANNLLRQLPFVDELFVQPAASDRGVALGCALEGAARIGEVPRGLDHVFLGPSYKRDQVLRALEVSRMPYVEVAEPSAEAAARVARGEIIGWFQGRAEFGPRALGHRSILADPTRPTMKAEINARVKFREEFRPFAPSVIEEAAGEIFDLAQPSPFMTVAVPVRPEWQTRLPAITHVDGTARVQTVSAATDPRYYDLIRHFGRHTGVPVVLNTSFNTMGEPIVETPLNALGTFAASGLDALVMDTFVIDKRMIGG